MQITSTETGPIHRAPFTGGPQVEVVFDADGVRRLAAARVVIPPEGSMPEHDHGDSEALVVPLSGELVMCSAGQEHKVTSGHVVHIARGERVALWNQTNEPAAILAVFTPPAFVEAFANWPTS